MLQVGTWPNKCPAPYINAESDHPPNIHKQLPLSVEARLSSLSSSKQMFDEAKREYQVVLTKNSYKHDLRYNPQKTADKGNKKKRKRNIIWFNPPYSKTVETNIGKCFLALLDKHFPRGSKFHKIFNRNTVKISYGCMTNMAAIINSHNKKVLGQSKNLERGGCNCQRGRHRNNCPLSGECLTKNLLYGATLSSDLRNYQDKKYRGITYNEFKEREGCHENTFRDEQQKNKTELSKEVWRIKENGGQYTIKWEIIGQYHPYNPSTKKCQLCLNEKLHILEYNEQNLLDKRSEIISKCKHKDKFLLKNI